MPLFYAAVENNEIKSVSDLQPFFVKITGMSGGELIDINLWCQRELNVPVYPESRVFHSISGYFCKRGLPAGKVVFLEVRPNASGVREISSFQCQSKDLR